MPEDNSGIQVEENALITPSSSDQSLIPPTPTPQPGEGTPTLPGDTGTEATDGGVVQPTGDAAPAATLEEPPAQANKTPQYPAWFQKRINSLTAEKNEARRLAAEAQAQAAALLEQLSAARVGGQSSTTTAAPAPAPVAQTPAVQQPPTVPSSAQLPVVPMTEAEIEARATAKAQEIARVAAFNKACNDIAEAGKTEFPDFDDSIKNLNMLGGMSTPMLETLTEIPNAHKVIQALGKDPDMAERVMRLPPVKMAMELARIESSLGKTPAPKPVSTAPKPITPIDGSVRAQEDPSNMSMEQFVKWREKTKTSRW